MSDRLRQDVAVLSLLRLGQTKDAVTWMEMIFESDLALCAVSASCGPACMTPEKMTALCEAKAYRTLRNAPSLSIPDSRVQELLDSLPNLTPDDVEGGLHDLMMRSSSNASVE